MHRFRRNATAALTAAALILGAAACGGDDEPQTKPTEQTTSASPSESPSSSVSDAWKKKYTKKQLTAYQDALDRWEEYEARSEPIWAKGKATEAAADLFKEYFPSPNWQGEYRRLSSYEQADVHVKGTPKVYWSKAKLITKNSLSVEITQCVDFSSVKVTQRGKPAKTNKWATVPHVRELSLSKPKGHDWLIYSYGDPDGRKQKCTP